MSLEDFIKPELLVLIPVLYLFGIGFKRSKIPDTLIPILLGAVSILLSASWVFATSDIVGARVLHMRYSFRSRRGSYPRAVAFTSINYIFNQKRKNKERSL